jgi:hypothetical protein
MMKLRILTKKKKKKDKKAATNPAPKLVTCCETYVNSGNHKAILLAMGIGMQHSLDTNEEPYLSSNNRCSFIPTAKVLTKEIQRQAVSLGMMGKLLPKPTNWVKQKLMDWLQNNPIRATTDIEYVQEQITAFDKLLKPALRNVKPMKTIGKMIHGVDNHLTCGCTM